MSKEKQIDTPTCTNLHQSCTNLTPTYTNSAVGEWISVDERLPENDVRVLVYMHENHMSYTKIDTDRVVRGKWVRWESCVTHWMPLPEAPKMKGGAE